MVNVDNLQVINMAVDKKTQQNQSIKWVINSFNSVIIVIILIKKEGTKNETNY